MTKRSAWRFRWVLLVVIGSLAGRAQARRPDQDVEDKKRIKMCQDALLGLVKDPSMFDGKSIPAGANFDRFPQYIYDSKRSISDFRFSWGKITKEGQAWPDASAAKAKFDDLLAYFDAAEAEYNRVLPIVTAERDRKARAEQDKAAAEKKAAEDEAARKQAAKDTANRNTYGACMAFWGKFGEPGSQRDSVERAGRILVPPGASIGSLAELKGIMAALDTAATVCKEPVYANAATMCTEALTRYEGVKIEQVCAAAAKRTEVLQTGLMKGLEHKLRGDRKAPTLAEFEMQEGWIQTTDPFTFEGDLVFSEASRAKALEPWKAMFAAAGIAMPDKHPAFDTMSAYYDAYRAVVEQTAGTWKTPPSRTCKGYWCALAKKSLKQMHPKAKLLKTLMENEIRLSRNNAGRAYAAYIRGWLLFQLPGEKLCQLRSFAVTEDGTGRADGVPLGFVRIQKCK